MIKLFRNVRRNLLNEGKTSKYLKYAIGEIILVVIGILIALSINNWNSNRIKHHKESVYLSNIQRDLEEQLISIEQQMAFEFEILKAAKPIIIYYKANHEFKVDSTFTATIGKLMARMTFVKNNPTYIELLSSGNIDIISNDGLKNELIKYYQEMERIEKVINKNNNLFTDAVFVPEMLKLTEIQSTDLYERNMFQGILSDIPAEISTDIVSLNEANLEAITRSNLQIPEKQLFMINAINYRYQLAIIHYRLLNKQKIKTQELLTKLKEDD
ncbi:DUF6090 family protein [Marixanthomonas ophiurae]|uniref:Uncharacterized protein n=1 Tax=Marixanthomonas ophiurae TaxID=387659 RepID=A0A3E1QD50_9FLAO|nr:DUF6090 family protein [Marixanthomonas ophiurae]RFN60079.1 hypothetical protein DZ858_08535 [Marixanthomonas ophiurae]